MMDSYTFQQKDDPILKVFALLFVPIMSYQCWIFQELPNYYLQHLLFYPCLLLFFWSFYKKYFNIMEAWRIIAPFLPWLAAIVAIYTFISWRSASLHPLENQSLAYATALSVIQLLVQIPFLFFFAFIVKILLLSVSVILIQLLYIIHPFFKSYFYWLSTFFIHPTPKTYHIIFCFKS